MRGVTLRQRIGTLGALAVLGFFRNAEAAPGGAAQEATTGAQATANDAALREARELFEEGTRAANQEDLGRALALMQRAHELSRFPWLLFNIGSLHEELGQCEPALRAFERYLESVPDRAESDFHPTARASIQRLRVACGEPQQTTPAPSPAIGSASPTAPRAQTPGLPLTRVPGESDRAAASSSSWWTPRRKVAVVLLTASGISASAALFYGWSAKRADDEFESKLRDARARPPAERPTWSEAGRGPQDERSAELMRMTAFSALSGVLLTAGVVLIVSTPASPPAREQAAVAPPCGFVLVPGLAAGYLNAAF